MDQENQIQYLRNFVKDVLYQEGQNILSELDFPNATLNEDDIFTDYTKTYFILGINQLGDGVELG